MKAEARGSLRFARQQERSGWLAEPKLREE